MDKNKKKIIMVVGIVVALLVIIFADKAFKNSKVNDDKKDNPGSEVTETAALEDLSDISDTPEASEDVPSDETGSEDGTEATEATETASTEKDDIYEYWLAAQAVTGISMKYFMGFEIEGIYITGETPLNAPEESDGVCVIFTTGGERLAVKSYYIGVERDMAGTMDIGSQNLGLATFDIGTAEGVSTEGMTEITVDDISTLIEKLLLVTIYER